VDGARLQVCDVADHAVIPHNRWLLRCGVNDGVVLDARACTDHDVPIVSAQDGPRPNRRMGPDANVADYHRIGMNERSRVDLRFKVSKCIQGHVPTVVRGGIRHLLPVP